MRQNLHLDSGADRLMLQLLLHCGTLGEKKTKKKHTPYVEHFTEFKSNNDIRPTMCNRGVTIHSAHGSIHTGFTIRYASQYFE